MPNLIMKFGKRWRGHSINYVAEKNPGYLRWLLTIPQFKERHPLEYSEVRRMVISQLENESYLESLA